MIPLQYYTFQKASIGQQIRRGYYFIVALMVLTCSLFLVFPKTSFFLVFIYLGNGLAALAIITFLNFLGEKKGASIYWLAALAGNLLCIDLLAMDSITCIFFQIPLSPIFALACLILTIKLMNDRIDPDLSKVWKRACLSVLAFMGGTILIDIVLIPAAGFAGPNAFMTAAKAALALPPTILVAFIYNHAILAYRQQLGMTEEINQKLVDSMRFVISGEIFVAMLHDMRDRISSLNWSLENTRTKYRNLLETAEFEDIGSSFGYIRCVADLFIDYIRMDTKAVARISVKSVLEKAVSFVCSSEKASKGIRFINLHESDPGPCIVVASEYRLFSVFLNILANAQQSLNSSQVNEKEIRTGIWRNDDLLTVKISDNGPGIRLEDQDKIFKGFTTKKSGTGLGLYFASKYVENDLRGSIQVESHANKATTFTICIPCAQDDRPALSIESKIAPSKQGVQP